MPFNSKSNKASSPLVKIQDVPDVPTIGTAVTGPEEALVAFTPAITGGKAALYRALSTPGSIEGVGATSPILVTGLEAGTSYTFQVRGETNLGATTGYSSASNAVVPEAGGAYDLLETQVLGTSASSVTFTGLGSYSDYKHLQLRAVTKTTRNGGNSQIKLTFNSDTAANYARHGLYVAYLPVLTGPTSYGITGQSGWGFGSNGTDWPNDFNAAVIDILDFANSNKYTTLRALQGLASTEGRIELTSGLWNNTAPVTSIDLTDAYGDNIDVGSRFSLYGVK